MKLTRKQPPNRRVIKALIPCVAGAVYFFGWRSLAMVAVSCAVAYFAEWLFCRKRNEAVSEAAFVTGTLYALILPPTVGWHIVVVGIVFGIVFTKEIFGGFGRNIFNPAMAGRAFVYVCFAGSLTALWGPNIFDRPDAKWYGALTRWSAQAEDQLVEWRTPDDPWQTVAYTGATPLGANKEIAQSLERIERRLDQLRAQPEDPLTARKIAAAEDELAELQAIQGEIKSEQITYSNLFFGDIRGTMGVTSTMLILIGGVYLFWTKTANRTIILSVVISCAVLAELLHLLGVPGTNNALVALMSGGFLFGAFFMATDPISSAKTFHGRIVYGCIIGCGRVIIQTFSVFPAGFMFALLLANMFAPIIDYVVQEREKAKKAKLAEANPAQEATA